MAWIAGERCKRVPLERAGDPGGWHGRAQRFAYGQIFPMAFCELVAIVIGDGAGEPVALARQRQHGQLHQLEPVDHHVEQTNLIGMDDILCIVEHYRLVTESFARLFVQHRLP